MEATATHVPGPWIVQPLLAKPGYPNWVPHAVRQGVTNVCLAVVGDVDRYYEGTEAATARLIAAAPALLAALEETLEELDSAWSDVDGARPTGTSAVMYRALAALRLARGA